MTLGQAIRRLLGPFTDPVARLYRGYYVDLDSLATTISKLSGLVTILEVGCGDGHLCEALARQSDETHILGIDPGVVPGSLYRGRSSNVEFRAVSTAGLLEADPPGFDAVVLCDVLHHVPLPERRPLVADAWRLTRGGGYLVVKDWVTSRNLATTLAYLSDRFVTGDRPEFFARDEDLFGLITGTTPGGRLVAEGSVPPHPNNRFLVFQKEGGAGHAGRPPGG